MRNILSNVIWPTLTLALFRTPFTKLNVCVYFALTSFFFLIFFHPLLPASSPGSHYLLLRVTCSFNLYTNEGFHSSFRQKKKKRVFHTYILECSSSCIFIYDFYFNPHYTFCRKILLEYFLTNKK